ncbi:MAG: hypothetical protein WAW86_01635 [Gammaproteobacteria bacterium]
MHGIFDENPKKRPKRPRVVSNPNDDNLDSPIPPKVPKYEEIAHPDEMHHFREDMPTEEPVVPRKFKP